MKVGNDRKVEPVDPPSPSAKWDKTVLLKTLDIGRYTEVEQSEDGEKKTVKTTTCEAYRERTVRTLAPAPKHGSPTLYRQLALWLSTVLAIIFRREG